MLTVAQAIKVADPTASIGQPFGLMEYYAPCYSNGSLAILFFGISRNGRNILASPNQAASISIQSPPSYSLATKPRVALVGNVTVFPNHYEGGEALQECYRKSHPDAWWVPGNKAGVHDVSARSCIVSMLLDWTRSDLAPSAIHRLYGPASTHT